MMHGKRTRARRRSSANEWFTEGFDTKDLKRTEIVLDALT